MNEVSTVSNLIMKLIAFAVALGCLGTLGDKVFNAKEKAATAIEKDQLSFGRWNRMLIGK